MATLGLPSLTACVLSPSTLLRVQVALQGAGPELHALPRSKLLRFRFSGTPQRRRLGWVCVLCLSGWSSSGNQVLEDHTLFRCSAPYSLRGPSLSFWGHPVRCALCLFWGAYLWLQPTRWMSTIQNLRKSLIRNWKLVCSLVGDALSGAEFAPFWFWLAPASTLPPAGDGPVHSRVALLWYCSVLCSVNRLAVPWVRAFHRLILSLCLSVSLSCYATV